MKKVSGKIVACVAAISIMGGVLCSCAPFYSRAGEMIRSIAQIRDEVQEQTANVVEGVGDITELAIDSGNGFAERVMEEIDRGFGYSSDAEWTDDGMRQYKPVGVIYEEANGEYWYHDKPLAGLYDAGYNTMTSSVNADIGAFVIIERDEKGEITGAYETDKETFQQQANIDLFENGEYGAQEMGYDYVREEVSVKGLDAAAFIRLENELRNQYRNQNVFVECKDYVFCFSKEDKLAISSCCYVDAIPYAARVYVDYQQDKEIDLNIFDMEKTDGIVMEELNVNGRKQDENALKDQIRDAVANAYGINWKYVIVDVIVV